MTEEERRAASVLGKQALVLIATGRASRQSMMINAAREACIAFRWRFGKATQRVTDSPDLIRR